MTPKAETLLRAITAYAEEVRSIYNDATIGGLNFRATVEGRTTEDLKVTFRYATSQYGEGVESSDPTVGLDEFLRRQGYERKQNVLKLTFSGEQKMETEDNGF